jgi:hypothetical protein
MSKCSEKDIFIHNFLIVFEGIHESLSLVVLIFVSFHQGKEKRKYRGLVNCYTASCRRKKGNHNLSSRANLIVDY